MWTPPDNKKNRDPAQSRIAEFFHHRNVANTVDFSEGESVVQSSRFLAHTKADETPQACLFQ